MSDYNLDRFASLSVRATYFINSNNKTHALTDSQRQHLTLNKERFIGWLVIPTKDEHRHMVTLEYPLLSGMSDEIEKDKKTLLDLLNG